MDAAFFLVRRHKHFSLDLSGIPPKRLFHFVPRLAEIAIKARRAAYEECDRRETEAIKRRDGDWW